MSIKLDNPIKTEFVDKRDIYKEFTAFYNLSVPLCKVQK